VTYKSISCNLCWQTASLCYTGLARIHSPPTGREVVMDGLNGSFISSRFRVKPLVARWSKNQFPCTVGCYVSTAIKATFQLFVWVALRQWRGETTQWKIGRWIIMDLKGSGRDLIDKISGHFLEGSEKTRKISVRIVCVPAEIWTKAFPKWMLEC
jgi:hypothetical protein